MFKAKARRILRTEKHMRRRWKRNTPTIIWRKNVRSRRIRKKRIKLSRK
jgi:hypothetical protein